MCVILCSAGGSMIVRCGVRGDGGPPHPLGLLQLLRQLLQGAGVPLPHVQDLGLVVLGLLVDGLLQLGHLLLSLGPGEHGKKLK